MPRKYSDQFRQQCIDEVLMFGKTRGAVAQEYGVSSSSLGRWVAKAEGTLGTGSGSHMRAADAASQDPAEMAKRIKELERENEFLKKAAAFFATEHSTKKATPAPATQCQ